MKNSGLIPSHLRSFSKNKMTRQKVYFENAMKINGTRTNRIRYALDNWIRKRCIKCKKVFYVKPMTPFEFQMKKWKLKTCNECSEVSVKWKRKGTEEDEKIYKERCKAFGIKLSYIKQNK